MGFMDKLVGMMKLNDESDDYDDYDEDDDTYMDEDDEDIYDDDEEEYEAKPELSHKKVRSGKITQMPLDEYDNRAIKKPVKVPISKDEIQNKKNVESSLEVSVIKPKSMDDSKDITTTLLDNRMVVLNLEGLDIELAQRIVDFTSGACFAIQGSLQKVSSFIFIATPPSVDVSGDLQGLIENSVEAANDGM